LVDFGDLIVLVGVVLFAGLAPEADLFGWAESVSIDLKIIEAHTQGENHSRVF
jgi:hypothetical protein